MKKLYRKGTVHPSPPVVSDHLSFLPAAILTLTAVLCPEDREVLAYLLISNNNTHIPSSSSANKKNHHDHPPMFSCDCFACYMSYWVRWDSSPNRHLIHEIIDQFEDGLAKKNNHTSKAVNIKSKKERRKQIRGKADSRPPPSSLSRDDGKGGLSSGERSLKDEYGGRGSFMEFSVPDGGTPVTCGGEVAEEGSMRRLVSFIGEKIWGVWN